MYKEKEFKSNYGINLQEMMEAGLHFGHRVSKCHPRMKPFLFGVRNTIHIIDPEKTAQSLEQALNFIKELISEDKDLVIVGTKIHAKKLVKEIAEKYDLSYVSERWIGGTLTNFKVIKKRTDHFKDLETEKKEGKLEKYTKRERVKIDRNLGNLRRKFEGIKNLERIPDAILVLDMKENKVTINEANKTGVKIIGIADTNIDPDLADFPIFASDNALSSIKYILDRVGRAIEEGKKNRTSKKEEK
jgi:small subunit ribosomal protein S2